MRAQECSLTADRFLPPRGISRVSATEDKQMQTAFDQKRKFVELTADARSDATHWVELCCTIYERDMGRISRLLYPETAADTVITITLFLTLGIWLVVQRYKTIRDRAVLFYWPAPPVRVTQSPRTLNSLMTVLLAGGRSRFHLQIHREPLPGCPPF